MPERGWYSLTVREDTAKRVRELARAKGLTVDGASIPPEGYMEFIKDLERELEGDEHR